MVKSAAAKGVEATCRVEQKPAKSPGGLGALRGDLVLIMVRPIVRDPE